MLLNLNTFGHFISNDLTDDRDTNYREVRNMFFSVNILARRFAQLLKLVRLLRA